jgi:hypothetical protein
MLVHTEKYTTGIKVFWKRFGFLALRMSAPTYLSISGIYISTAPFICRVHLSLPPVKYTHTMHIWRNPPGKIWGASSPVISEAEWQGFSSPANAQKTSYSLIYYLFQLPQFMCVSTRYYTRTLQVSGIFGHRQVIYFWTHLCFSVFSIHWPVLISGITYSVMCQCLLYKSIKNTKMLKVKVSCCNSCLSLLGRGGVANNVFFFLVFPVVVKTDLVVCIWNINVFLVSVYCGLCVCGDVCLCFLSCVCIQIMCFTMI